MQGIDSCIDFSGKKKLPYRNLLALIGHMANDVKSWSDNRSYTCMK